MKLSKTKINITLGVLTGILIGFVFGAAYGTPERLYTTTGSGEGNISRLTKQCLEMTKDSSVEDSAAPKDTLHFEAIDEAGHTWKIEVTQ